MLTLEILTSFRGCFARVCAQSRETRILSICRSSSVAVMDMACPACFSNQVAGCRKLCTWKLFRRLSEVVQPGVRLSLAKSCHDSSRRQCALSSGRVSGVSVRRFRGANCRSGPKFATAAEWTCLEDLGLLSKSCLLHLPGEYRAQVRWACLESKIQKVIGRYPCPKYLESRVRGHLPICESAGRMRHIAS